MTERLGSHSCIGVVLCMAGGYNAYSGRNQAKNFDGGPVRESYASLTLMNQLATESHGRAVPTRVRRSRSPCVPFDGFRAHDTHSATPSHSVARISGLLETPLCRSVRGDTAATAIVLSAIRSISTPSSVFGGVSLKVRDTKCRIRN